jgi:uncharacterized protein
MDEHYQAGTKGLKYAAKKGLGIVVMEPIRGGLLAKELAGIAEIWERADVQHTPAEWALRWVWNHPDVTVVLSGMSIPAQVRQNVDLTKDGLPNSLTKAELALFKDVKEELEMRVIIPCTGCKYCVPCPHGVSVPECLNIITRGTYTKTRNRLGRSIWRSSVEPSAAIQGAHLSAKGAGSAKRDAPKISRSAIT